MPGQENSVNEKPLCFVPRTDRACLTFHGVPTFLGVAAVRAKSDLVGYDAAVMGVPWEGPLTWGGSSGCELATKTIREASQRYGGYLPEFDYDFFDHIRICDYGDTAITPGDSQATNSHIREKVGSVYDSGAVPIIFGGDHSITPPAVEALAERHPKKVGIVHFDSHLDNMESFGAERHARCCPLHRIYDNKYVDSSRIIHMGIRGPRNNPLQMENARRVGAQVMTAFEIKEKGVEYALKRALEVVGTGTDAIYVTVCSDILDVAFNPGGPPDVNGLTPFELTYLLYGLATNGIAGFDFVEIYPLADRNNVSSHTAAWMGIYVLSGIAKRKMNLGWSD